MLTALWREIVATNPPELIDSYHSQGVRVFEIECARAKRCCPSMLRAVLSEGQFVAGNSGIRFDSELGAWIASKRAADQWREFRRKGNSWRDFFPVARHSTSQRELRALAGGRPLGKSAFDSVKRVMPFVLVPLPAVMKCPNCGWMNSVVAPQRLPD